MPVVMVKSKLQYEDESIFEAVREQLDRLQVRKELTAQTRVVIKPNLLAARMPEQAVTTHPSVVKAVARYLKEAGVRDICIAESSGGSLNAAGLTKLYRVTGLSALSELARLNTDTSHGEKNGFSILRAILESDYIIDCAKLKTHGLTVMTGGVKNLFGCIPGLEKAQWHCRRPKRDPFCEMLVKLCETVRPNITLIDAVSCMQGNGPGGGESRYMGFLLASRSPYAADEAAARLMGYSPESMPLIRAARRLAPMSDSVTLEGDELIPADPPFILPDSITGDGLFFTPRGLLRLVRGRTVPVVDESRCTGCGKCAESCPKHIIHIRNHKAKMRTLHCISCFCCQEMCPSHAIKTRKARF